MDMSMEGAVFVQTNAAHNEVIAFTRSADGSLQTAGEFATGGAGDGSAHLPSQGSVTLTRDRRHLLVTNVMSNDVSVFAITGAMLELTKTVPVGAAPRSVIEHDGLVYVLATGDAMIKGFRLVDGDLVPLEGGTRALSTPDGAQVGFSPDGRALVVTERGGDKISSYAVGMDGMLGDDRTIDSLGATPYGFAISNEGTLVVTEAFRAEKGAAATSSYRIDGHAIMPGTASVGKRSQRDLLGRHLQGRSLRLYHELRRRRGVPLRDRLGRVAHARRRHSRDHRGRPAGPPRRGPVRRRAVPVRDRRGPGPDRGLVGR
jgi:6-phosphogluconolactonase (cycloisomerase 2 family)